MYYFIIRLDYIFFVKCTRLKCQNYTILKVQTDFTRLINSAEADNSKIYILHYFSQIWQSDVPVFGVICMTICMTICITSSRCESAEINSNMVLHGGEKIGITFGNMIISLSINNSKSLRYGCNMRKYNSYISTRRPSNILFTIFVSIKFHVFSYFALVHVIDIIIKFDTTVEPRVTQTLTRTKISSGFDTVITTYSNLVKHVLLEFLVIRVNLVSPRQISPVN